MKRLMLMLLAGGSMLSACAERDRYWDQDLMVRGDSNLTVALEEPGDAPRPPFGFDGVLDVDIVDPSDPGNGEGLIHRTYKEPTVSVPFQ